MEATCLCQMVFVSSGCILWVAYVWINVEALVVEHGGGELHHLGQNEEILQTVRDFFGDELHEVGHQLV